MTFPCAYFSPTLDRRGLIDEPRLERTTERHKLTLPCASLSPADPANLPENVRGMVIEMSQGWPTRAQLGLTASALTRSLRVWLYWPDEGVVECVDRERLASWRRHWTMVVACNRIVLPVKHLVAAVQNSPATLKRWLRGHLPLHWIRSRRSRRIVSAFFDLIDPIPLMATAAPSDARIRGTGVYLRTDFWARIESGGSYGHTCYVAKELARVTDDFACFMAHRFALIDQFGIRQIEMPMPPGGLSENAIVEATRHYFPILREYFRETRPAYIYERLGLGSYAAAVLSQEFRVPYIVEYNGSEISMLRTFDKSRYIYERVYLMTEELAFRQATFISVVSEEIKRTLIARGVPASKILVNPNGADLDAYSPASADEKRAIRGSVGLQADSCVVGFSGTFGGWHGVDVLAAAIPRICAANPRVTFLLIGDGSYKHQVDMAVEAYNLQSRVISVGRVPQAEGARLLKACDIYVSPHSSHMVDSRFFGSPTKVFEYMAMAGGVVASDLEQIGLVLSPALRVPDLRRSHVSVADERSVLCAPGDVDEFVEAVTLLSQRPDLSERLGRNARQAVADHYSWQRHVAHLWTFARAEGPIWGRPGWRPGAFLRKRWSNLLLHSTPEPEAPRPALSEAITESPAVVTGDPYKDEVQRQWDNDPAGSHYVKGVERNSLEWFLEAEAYRYREYAPWMADVMEFDRHAGERVLEIGGGMGTDLAQFARHGAQVTDLDLSSGHLELAKQSFARRHLTGEFILNDAETMPFDDNTFDLVYSNGVIHHTPNTHAVVAEMRRVLKPGGKAIVMVYAENSLHYWRNLVWEIGVKEHQLERRSMGDIMSDVVERSDNAAARPLVKVYTKARLRELFKDFTDIEIVRRQMVHSEVPRLLARVPVSLLGRYMGWNLVIKARKPLA